MLQDDLQRLAARTKAIRVSVPDEAAIHHAAGQATFVDDIPDLAGTLHVAVGLSPIAAGELTKLDLNAVGAAREVVLTLTATDIPGLNDASPERTQDQPIICARRRRVPQTGPLRRRRPKSSGRARRCGAGGISTTSALSTTDLDDALATNATLLGDYGLFRGEADEEIKRCDRKLMGQIRVGGQDHFFLEPYVSLAIPSEGGGMHIITAAEDPALVQQVVAEMLELSANAVTVEVRARRRRVRRSAFRRGTVGGDRRARGMADGAARKLRLDHADGVATSGKRQSVKIDYTVGINDAGLINGLSVTFAARSGSGVDFSVETNDRTVLSADNAYYYPALSILVAPHALAQRPRHDDPRRRPRRGYPLRRAADGPRRRQPRP